VKITIVQGAFFPVPPLRGGAVEKIWFSLGREFARSGHEVTHVSRAFGELPHTEIIENVRHIRVGGFDTPRSLILLKTLDLLYSLHTLTVLPAADILVTNTFWLPILIRSNRCGRLYVHVARYPKGQLRYYAHAARLQSISHPIEEAMVSEVPWCRRLIKCIHPPLPESGLAGPIPSGNRPKQILYAGRVHPEKGLHLLLAAIALIPEDTFAGWKLVVVGPAETSGGGGGANYLAELKNMAASIQQRVVWVGAVYDSAQLASYYRTASLFVYPSLAERGETFGLAPLEAMSHGCPALVSNLACFRDFVTAEVNGFVFNHRTTDPASTLADSITRLIRDDSRIDRVREAALMTARSFSPERIAGLYLADFQSLLAPGLPTRHEDLRAKIAL